MSKKSNALAVIPAPTVVSRGRRVLVQGANAGARRNIPALVDSVESMPGEISEIIYGDAVFAHARRAADEAAALGLPARPVALTARGIEQYEPHLDLVIGHLDRAAAHREAMRATLARDASYLGYQFVLAPSMLAQGVMVAVAPDDRVATEEAELLWSTIAPITARRGSAAIFREGAPEQSFRETVIREKFRDHTRSVVKKLVAELPLDVDPLQVTDGQDAFPLVVLASDRWCSNDEIEQRVIHERHDLVIEPGSRLLVAECLSGDPPEIRFHDGRFNRRDRRLVTRSSHTLTQANFDAPPPMLERSGRSIDRSRDDGDLAGALAGLALIALLLGAASRTSPVHTTD